MKALYRKPEMMQKMVDLIDTMGGKDIYKFILTKHEYDKYLEELGFHPVLGCTSVLFMGREIAVEVPA